MAWNFYDSNGNLLQSSAIADDSIVLAYMSANSVDSDQYVDGSIDTAHIAASQITNALMADDAIDSAEIADGSVDLAHMSADSVDSSQYVDGSIDTVHIADNQVTLAKMAGIARGKIIYGDASGDPAVLAVGSADQVLTHDGTDVSWEAAGGISNIQQWYADADIDVGTSTTTLLSGWSEQSGTWYGEIGTSMAESSGIWTFPTTGLWKIEFKSLFYSDASSRFTQGQIWVTTNNADYAKKQQSQQSLYTGSGNGYSAHLCSITLDVSSTTNVKIKLYGYIQDEGGSFGGTTAGGTIMFTRVGVED